MELEAARTTADVDALAAELEQLRGAGIRLQRLDAEIQSARNDWRKAADALGGKRRKAGSG